MLKRSRAFPGSTKSQAPLRRRRSQNLVCVLPKVLFFFFFFPLLPHGLRVALVSEELSHAYYFGLTLNPEETWKVKEPVPLPLFSLSFITLNLMWH